MSQRSRAHYEDLVPPPEGIFTLKLKVRVTPKHRRALATRLGLGRQEAGARQCVIALETLLEKYLAALERDAFAGELLAAIEKLGGE
jgi:hypothetical protein